MDNQEFRRLNVGDTIKHKLGSVQYVVTGNYGGRVTAVKSVDVTNPDEWELVIKVQSRKNMLDEDQNCDPA